MSNESKPLPENPHPQQDLNAPIHIQSDPDLTVEEEEELKRKIAELRKRDPFIYR